MALQRLVDLLTVSVLFKHPILTQGDVVAATAIAFVEVGLSPLKKENIGSLKIFIIGFKQVELMS